METRTGLFSLTKTGFFVIYLVMLSNAFYLGFVDSTNLDKIGRASGSANYNIIWGTLYVGMTLLLFVELPRSNPRTWPIAGAFALISAVAYAQYGVQAGSLLKFACFLMTLVFSGWAAANFTTDRALTWFFRVSLVIALIHLAMYPWLSTSKISIIYDRLQRDTLLGTKPYAGLFAHKNFAATFFVQGLVVGLGRLISRNGKFELSTIFGIGLQLVCLAISGAVSPVLTGFICIAVMVCVSLYAAMPLASLALGLIATLSTLALIAVPETWLSLFHRDASFTGRTYLYTNWAKYAINRLFFGYGYGEAFNGMRGSLGENLNASSGISYSNYTNFESGLLQGIIEFGLCGFVVFAIMFFFAGRFSMRILRRKIIRNSVAPLGLFLYCLISSLNEVVIIVGNTTTLFLIGFLYAKWFYRDETIIGVDPAAIRRLRAEPPGTTA